MAQEIIIEVSPSGETKVTAKGIKGHKCTDVTFEIQKALGTTVKDEATQEMYEKPVTTRNKQ